MANSKLARSLRVKLQLRDKKGRWIEMGRGGKWFSSLDGLMKSGVVIGSKGNNAIIREKNADGSLGPNNIEVPMNTLEMIPSKASLDPATQKLMNEYNEGQSAKGKKESAAREKALSDAMASEQNGGEVQDEVEVEYEASAQEELEDLLDAAPEGAILSSGNDSLKKAADGSWQSEMMERSSKEVASTADTDEYVYASEDEHAEAINKLFDEIENGPSTVEETAPEQAAVESPAEPEALIDISAWKYHQGTQGGSNPGGIYTDTEGNDHYVKKSKSDMHAKNEVMADKFYEKLGVKTSQLKLADVGGGKLGTSSKMVPGSKNDFYSKSMSDPAYKKKFQEDFAIDAWLANWDVVGLEYDNALTDANGDPIRIDPGGALLYRAMGSPKGDMFGNEVGEWESMRNGSNPASKIFGSMTDEDLKNSAAKLNNISEQDIADIVDSMDFEPDVADYLKNTLVARKQNILDKFPELANEDQNAPETALEDPADAPAAVAVDTPAPQDIPEAGDQTAKPEPINTDQVAGTEDAPEKTDYQTKKEAWKAKKETYRSAALAGEKLDFSDIPSNIVDGDKHYEDYWEDEDDTTPDFAGHFESYTIAEADALGEYVADSTEINGILRGNKGVYNHLTEDEFEFSASVINKLDDLISKSVVQEDTTVYRGIAMRQSALDKFLENGAYEDLAYSSTSKENFLATSWSAVDPSIDPDRVQVVLKMQIPAGFNAHKVDYLATDKKSYANEKEVLLPRGTKFAIVESDMGTEPEAGKAKSVVLTVAPILNDSNYKPEGIKNGQGSNNTADSGDGNSIGDSDNNTTDSGSNDNSEDVSDGPAGGGYENPSEGADTAGDAAESGPEGLQEPEVAPTAPEAIPAADNLTPAGNDMGEEIPIINGAKAMLSQMAKKQGISVEQLQKDLGLPADGAFPNKGKTVSNDNGDVFEANSIVANPKFGEGIASIILPSTNSVKVLYADHGFKVTQAKNLSLVSGTAPQEVASQAVNLDGAAPGDIGINPANGKMYFVDKNGAAKYVGDEVEYTKKGVTQHGKVASIYKGTKTAKIEWDDDTASVKKASQLVGKDDDSSSTDAPETQEESSTTDPVTNTSEDAPDATEVEGAPVAAEPATPVAEDAPQTPENVSEDVTPAADSTTPEVVEEALEGTPATEDKGWTPASGYDPMGHSKVQIHGDMKTATVYPHDNSSVAKDDFNLLNKIGYNPVEDATFGTGQSLTPLYVGDKVDYLFNGKKYSGEIVEIKPNQQAAIVLLDDGTKKAKKFSQLSGNYPKTVDVDSNGNYTDWHGNAAQIPNIKGEDSTPEVSVPETPAVEKPEWGSIVDAPNGTILDIDDDHYLRITGSYYGNWWNPKTGAYIDSANLFNKFDNSNSVTITEAPTSTNLFSDDLDELGSGAKISSANLGIDIVKDNDGDWYHYSVGYKKSNTMLETLVTDDWVIDNVGSSKPAISAGDLNDKALGQILDLDGEEFVKFGENDEWWSKSAGESFAASQMVDKISDAETARFGDELSSNLSEGELYSMKQGAEISSEKLGMTITKDSDGDWTADTGNIGYFSDSIIEYLVADDWVVESTGVVEPNYSTYDLDSASQYSEIYSPELEKTFEKSYEDSWMDAESGKEYSAAELLTEFPTDDWSLSESEIDENYSYGNTDESTLSELKLGSKISHTDSPHNPPQTFMKVDEDEWAQVDYQGKPSLHSIHNDSDFADGYSYVEYEADEDEYEKPRPLNITPNSPDISSEDVSLEWLESAPTGTAIKSAQSEKWTYIKNTEGKWVTTSPEGGTGAAGTSEQVYNASKDKHDLTNIYVPGADENTAAEEAPVVEQVAADFATGTFIPQTGATDAGFTKVGDNQWKMTSAGQEIDHILEDSFIDAFQKAAYSAPVLPTPDSDDTDIVTPAEEVNIPEDLPENIQGMSPDAFDAIPVTTKMINDDSGYTYEKISPTVWVSYKGSVDDAMKVEFTSDTFHSILNLSMASKFKIQPKSEEESENNVSDPSAPKLMYGMTLQELKDAPQGATISYAGTESWNIGKTLTKNAAGEWENSQAGVPNDTSEGLEFFTKEPMIGKNWMFNGSGQVSDDVSAADLAGVPTTTDTQAISFAEFQKLPVGTKIVPSWGEGWKKTDDGEWESISSGNQFFDDNFTSYVGKGFQDGMTIVYPDTSSSNTEESANTLGTSKPLGDTSVEEILNAPVGSVVTHLPTGDTYTKSESGMWTSGKAGDMDHTADSIAWVIGKPSEVQYTYTPAQSPEKINYPESLAGFTNTDDFDKLPIGSTIGTVDNPDIYTKTGKNKWGIASNPDKHTDSTFHYIITSDGGDVYKLNVPEGATPVDNTVDEPTSVSSMQDGPKTLAGIGEAEYKALPVGTILSSTNGATMTKKDSENWVHSNGTVFESSILDIIYSGPDAGNWTISPAMAGSDTPSPNAPGVHKGQKVSKELADSYPVGTVIKKENPAYYGMAGQFYYVKLEDGTWQAYKQTDKTLSAKTINTSGLFDTWYSTASVSVPKSSDHFVTHTGELGYVGDNFVLLADEGGTYKATKIMKTGIKITDGNGDSITVKPQKLKISSSTFGMKPSPTEQTNQSGVPTVTASEDSIDVDLGYDVKATEDFAGASAEEYNNQGLSMPHVENPKTTPSFTLTPAHEPDPSNALYGTPQPSEPAVPEAYPAFEAPKLELPKWDSAAWLAKVEQRYLDNPNKAKDSVQQSNKWTAIQSVMNGEKNNLANLLDSKYLDQDLFEEANAGIDAKTAENAQLVEQHSQQVNAAKEAYDAQKAEHFANYKDLKSKFDADLIAWMAANPDPNAMKPLNKPKTSSENFTGGPADWTKAHIGTHTAESVFASIKADNDLGKHGLSIATDSDKVENLDVNVTKTLNPSGEEVFDMRFKVTQAHGKVLASWAKKEGSVEKSSTIYPPNMKLDTNSGLLKDTGSSGKGGVSGDRFEFVHENTGAKIIFQRSKSEKNFNNDTNHNSVRVLMPTAASPEEYQQVLDYLGIEGKPASEGDIRVLAENKLISVMGEGTDAIGAGNLKGADRMKALNKIKTEYGVTADDVVFSAEPNGRVRSFFSDKATKKLAQKFTNIQSFSHNLSSGSDVDTMMNIIAGPTPGLLSTYHRWSNGLSQSGMSSSTDMSYGSGDYIYTTPQKSLHVSGNNVSIHPEAMLRKLDVWANSSDNYGKKNSDSYDMGAIKKLDKLKGSLHEYLPTDTISINDMQYISVYSGIRAELIKRLKARGILKINGINIEDFILSQGMTPPAVDYIPGIGVVPAGTTWDPTLGAPAAGDAGAIGGPAI